MAVSVATAGVLLGLGKLIGIELSTEFAGISAQVILGLANVLVIYALWKEL